MDASAFELIQHGQDVRHLWQGRVLALAEGRMMIAVSSILAHEYDAAMAVMFRVVKPRCWDDFRQTLRTPFLCSCGKVSKTGAIVADAIMDERNPPLETVMFTSERDFEYELRKLADRARLSDDERLEFFAVAKRWVVADRRLDPTMDPRDPDAKRLVH